MPAESKKQRRFMGMVHAVQTGEIAPPSAAVAEVARTMKPSDAREFAETKEKGLPTRKKPLRRVHVDDSVRTKSF
jgi:hypothetical protein